MRKVQELSTLHVIAIIALASINGSLNNFTIQNGDHTNIWSSIVGSLVFAVPVAMLVFYVQVALLHFTGRMLGGKTSFEGIQTAVALSRIPVVWGLLIWAVRIAVYGEQSFKHKATVQTSLVNNAITYSNPISGPSGEGFLFSALGIISAIIGIWAFIILLNCLSEVQEFSISNALLNVVAAFVLPVVLSLLLLAPFMTVVGSRPG